MLLAKERLGLAESTAGDRNGDLVLEHEESEDGHGEGSSGFHGVGLLIVDINALSSSRPWRHNIQYREIRRSSSSRRAKRLAGQEPQSGFEPVFFYCGVDDEGRLGLLEDEEEPPIISDPPTAAVPDLDTVVPLSPDALVDPGARQSASLLRMICMAASERAAPK